MNERLKGGLLFLVLGIGAVAVGSYWASPYVLDTANSEPVEAEVVSSDWYSATGAEGDERYYVDVTYRYTYGGEQYTSDTVFPGGRNEVSSRSRAEEIASSYAPGDGVTAHVVAGDGSDSYLIESAMPWWYYLVPGFGVFLVLAALLNIVQGIRGVEPA